MEVDVRRNAPVPRTTGGQHSVAELRDLLSDIGAQREFASLLQHYDIEDLARKGFGTATLLKRTFKHYQAVRQQLDSSGLNASRALIGMELQKVESNVALLNRFWDDQFKVAKSQVEQEASDHAQAFKRAAQAHAREEQALQLRIDELSRENDDLRTHARMLEDRLKAGSLNVGNVMNFLNRHNTRVDGNCPRLKARLEYAKDNRLPPGGWATQIMVNAVDDFSVLPGPFAVQDDGDPTRKKRRAMTTTRKKALKKVRLDATAEITEALYSEVGGDEGDESRDETFQAHKPFVARLDFQPRTAKAVCQTAEFPDYTPNLSKNGDLDAVRVRWKLEEVKELWVDAPWDDRIENRLKYLILHVSPPPGSVQQMYLDKIVTFMSNNRRAFWRIGHWFVIHHQLDAYSLGLQSKRKNECDKARILYQALLDEAVNAGCHKIYSILALGLHWASYGVDVEAPHLFTDSYLDWHVAKHDVYGEQFCTSWEAADEDHEDMDDFNLDELHDALDDAALIDE
ncbi:uncharacterized protein IUM83_12543 [Phytophthora cinnamomi]|uniref:uncharacterized protein n=1 Tax=Phytophthora cinnamomi TaxID=4785 RepID=UPI00355A4FA9|nr:hypothetical protein IUM83_12543 [Phytophthora cinnamomi]